MSIPLRTIATSRIGMLAAAAIAASSIQFSLDVSTAPAAEAATVYKSKTAGCTLSGDTVKSTLTIKYKIAGTKSTPVIYQVTNNSSRTGYIEINGKWYKIPAKSTVNFNNADGHVYLYFTKPLKPNCSTNVSLGSV